jgi:hypothetical protein
MEHDLQRHPPILVPVVAVDDRVDQRFVDGNLDVLPRILVETGGLRHFADERIRRLQHLNAAGNVETDLSLGTSHRAGDGCAHASRQDLMHAACQPHDRTRPQGSLILFGADRTLRVLISASTTSRPSRATLRRVPGLQSAGAPLQ